MFSTPKTASVNWGWRILLHFTNTTRRLFIHFTRHGSTQRQQQTWTYCSTSKREKILQTFLPATKKCFELNKARVEKENQYLFVLCGWVIRCIFPELYNITQRTFYFLRNELMSHILGSWLISFDVLTPSSRKCYSLSIIKLSCKAHGGYNF